MSSADKRRSTILDQVIHQKEVRVHELSRQYQVSEVAIRRDLEMLEQHGLLKRVHGGAVAIPGGAQDRSYAAKIQRNIEEKQRIGQAAAQLIQPGDQILFDSSTTALQVARAIPGDLLRSGNLTIICACLPIVQELGQWKDINLIVLGGIYLPEFRSLIGPTTLRELSGLRANKAFIGTDGLTIENGATGSNLLEIEVDRGMANAANEVIIVADASKMGKVGLATLLPVNRITKLITDVNAPPDMVQALRELNVEVTLV